MRPGRPRPGIISGRGFAALLASSTVCGVLLAGSLERASVNAGSLLGGSLSPSFGRMLLFCLAIQLLTVALLNYRSLAAFVASYLNEPEHPLNPAVVRILFFGFWLLAAEEMTRAFSAAATPELWGEPFGLAAVLPESLSGALLRRIWSTACLLAALGLFSRTSALVAALSGEALLSQAALFDEGASLALFPIFALCFCCGRPGDMLSLDALLARRVAALTPSARYGLSLRLGWLCLAAVYTLHSVQSVWKNGLGWASSVSMTKQLYYAWLLQGGVAPLRLDQSSLACLLFGVLELVSGPLLLVLLFSRTHRRSAAMLKGILQVLNRLAGRIPWFMTDWLLLSFVDWHRLLSRAFMRLWPERIGAARRRAVSAWFAAGGIEREQGRTGRDSRSGFLTRGDWTAASIVAAAFVCCAYERGLQPYPFLTERAPEVVQRVTYALYRSGSDVEPSPRSSLEASHGTFRYRVLTERLAKQRGAERAHELRALWDADGERDGRHVETVQFYRDSFLTDPRFWNFNPSARELLFDLRLDALRETGAFRHQRAGAEESGSFAARDPRDSTTAAAGDTRQAGD